MRACTCFFVVFLFFSLHLDFIRALTHAKNQNFKLFCTFFEVCLVVLHTQYVFRRVELSGKTLSTRHYHLAWQSGFFLPKSNKLQSKSRFYKRLEPPSHMHIPINKHTSKTLSRQCTQHITNQHTIHYKISSICCFYLLLLQLSDYCLCFYFHSFLIISFLHFKVGLMLIYQLNTAHIFLSLELLSSHPPTRKWLFVVTIKGD